VTTRNTADARYYATVRHNRIDKYIIPETFIELSLAFVKIIHGQYCSLKIENDVISGPEIYCSKNGNVLKLHIDYYNRAKNHQILSSHFLDISFT
jgi:peptidyl-tRNA hydrolase